MFFIEWCVGFVVVLLLTRIVRLEVSGFPAVFILIFLAWGIGKFIMMLLTNSMCTL
jgi:hypothetical protein